jgi:hypothetical protein
MIIKGGSRAGPSGLANHLQRQDTNERVLIVEVAWATDNLKEALRDWQALAAGTSGTKGLYHANIDPAKDYQMTGEQWAYAVQQLEAELGLEGQPRAVVLHQKHGREHIHVVWARTDIDTMTMRSDSQNYAAHERVARQLEQTFGHQLVPGPHTGRDPDLPSYSVTMAEWQMAERTGISTEERRDLIRQAWAAADSPEAFREALADKGYVLAQGDRRGYVAVDRAGDVIALSKRVLDLPAQEIRDRLSGLGPIEALPSVTEAKEAQARARAAERALEPPTYGSAADAAMLAALASRQAEERAKLEAEQTAAKDAVAAEQAERERAAAKEIEARLAKPPKPKEPEPLLARLWRGIVELVSPSIRQAREAEEARQKAAFEAEKERQRQAHLAELARALEAERTAIAERQAQERRALEIAQEQETIRRLADAQRARDIAEKIDAARRVIEEQQRRQGLGQDPPDQSRAR